MDILLVAATEMEIKEFILTGLSETNHTIDLLITGIGMPLTIFHLTKQLSQKKYDLVIQAGIAGTFNNKYKTGSVVIVEKEFFGEIGVEEKDEFKTIFEKGLADGNIFPFEDGFINNENELLEEIDLPKVCGVTINRISDSKSQMQFYKMRFNADVESMEGSGLHLVCKSMNQPFIQLRSISNEVGERDKAKWDMKGALKNLNKELLKVVNHLSK